MPPECSWVYPSTLASGEWHMVTHKHLLSLIVDIHDASVMPDTEKLRVYVRIVRLLLEDEDSVQAETYYNRAALLVHSASDRETLLQFKLCQARISDYGRKFLEAASRYHELSWVGEIDEEERRHMLYVSPPTTQSYISTHNLKSALQL